MTNSEQQQEESHLKVAIQGYAGAFHDVAAHLYFGDQAIEIVPAHTFDDLVQAVETGKVDTALMAIENSLAGSLMYNYSLLNDSKLQIDGEVYLRIKQNLMVLPGVQIEDLEEVHSHPMAIAQTRNFFRNYPKIRLIENADTALSAKMIQERRDRTKGAIASSLAAELYQLEIVAPSIETNKQNYTRFLVLTKRNSVKQNENGNKVSLCFSTAHEVGSLHQILGVMSAYQMNLTKIQSTPIVGKAWEYRFFIDFIIDGRFTLSQGIEAIRPLTSELKILGIYPKGNHYEH